MCLCVCVSESVCNRLRMMVTCFLHWSGRWQVSNEANACCLCSIEGRCLAGVQLHNAKRMQLFVECLCVCVCVSLSLSVCVLAFFSISRHSILSISHGSAVTRLRHCFPFTPQTSFLKGSPYGKVIFFGVSISPSLSHTQTHYTASHFDQLQLYSLSCN